MTSSKDTSLRGAGGNANAPDDGAVASTGAPSSADAPDAQPAPAWDPYDVWLRRVKQPRDETLRQRKLEQQEPMQDAEETAETPPINPNPRPSAA